jgi:phosphohistidine phosphatase
VILYFLRHGEAESAPAADDEARDLTAGGAAALRSAAPLWRRLNLRPDVVITSPLRRAHRTALLIADALGLREQPIVDDRLRPGARWDRFAQAMTPHPDARRVLFVGHEPDLSGTIALLTGAASVRMRPGGLACVEFYGTPEPGGGELAWLLDPDLCRDEREGA